MGMQDSRERWCATEIARQSPGSMAAGLDVLVHPLTEISDDDHSKNALWLGTPVPMRHGILRSTYRSELLPLGPPRPREGDLRLRQARQPVCTTSVARRRRHEPRCGELLPQNE